VNRPSAASSSIRPNPARCPRRPGPALPHPGGLH
jgi:hypothetical protein